MKPLETHLKTQINYLDLQNSKSITKPKSRNFLTKHQLFTTLAILLIILIAYYFSRSVWIAIMISAGIYTLYTLILWVRSLLNQDFDLSKLNC